MVGSLAKTEKVWSERPQKSAQRKIRVVAAQNLKRAGVGDTRQLRSPRNAAGFRRFVFPRIIIFAK